MFKDGWLRYWQTFMLPWPAVVGFGVASVVSAVLYELLKGAVLMAWRAVELF